MINSQLETYLNERFWGVFHTSDLSDLAPSVCSFSLLWRKGFGGVKKCYYTENIKKIEYYLYKCIELKGNYVKKCQKSCFLCQVKKFANYLCIICKEMWYKPHKCYIICEVIKRYNCLMCYVLVYFKGYYFFILSMYYQYNFISFDL